MSDNSSAMSVSSGWTHALGCGIVGAMGGPDDDTSDDAMGVSPEALADEPAAVNGIRVEVSSQFLPEHSRAAERRWAFSYTVTISNCGSLAATLMARHWVITDATGHTEHVRGPGVVGHQPQLGPGESFTYTSGAILRTTHGVMHGEYLMERPDGSRFEAFISPFALTTPEAVN